MISPADYTIRDFLARVYAPRRLVGKSSSNLRQHGIQIRHLERFLGREPMVSDLTDGVIGGLLNHLLAGLDKRGKPRSPATVNKARSHLVALADMAARKRLIDEPLDVSRLPEPEPQPVAWRSSEIKALLEACSKMVKGPMCIPAADWWEAYIRMSLDSGERSGAILDIEMPWIIWREAWVRIPGGARKGGEKSMDYPLKASTLEALQRIRWPGRRMLFPLRGCLGTFYDDYSKLLELAGLPDGRRRKGQGLRVTFGSHLELHGGDATKAFRHSSRRTTERSYIDKTLVKPPNPSEIIPEW